MPKFFKTRKVEMSDRSELYEIVTPDGYRVVSATDEATLVTLEDVLNATLEQAEANRDVVVNV